MSTIYDVANLVGVSSSAVAAVLGGRPVRVSDKTRQRIIEGAKTLGYRVNRTAQQLATGKFNTIAVCYENIDGYCFFNSITNLLMGGIGRSVTKNGLDLLFALITPSTPKRGFIDVIDSLSSRGVDGGIVIGPIPKSEEVIAAINSCSVPLVCLDSIPGIENASTVDWDNFAGMKMGVEHLISSGHKKIAYICRHMPLEYQCFIDRMNGFSKAVEEAGLPNTQEMINRMPNEDVALVTSQILATIDGLSALVCGDSWTAMRVLDEVEKHGLSVPDDLTILTYDDISGQHPLAASTNMVIHNDYIMGEAAGDLLNKLINGECTGPVSQRFLPDLLLCKGLEGK